MDSEFSKEKQPHYHIKNFKYMNRQFTKEEANDQKCDNLAKMCEE